MKKIFIVCLLACIGLSGSAQIIKSTTSERTMTKKTVNNDSWHHSGLFVNTGIGVLSGDVESDLGWEFGWGYRWHIASGFSWEVFRIGFNTGVSHFKDTFDLRFTTGFRYDTERFNFLGDRSMFANVCFGYGTLPLCEYDGCDIEGGFQYEIGLGIKLNRRTSLSLFWQGDSNKLSYWKWEGSDSYSWGLFGAKIEYQFR